MNKKLLLPSICIWMACSCGTKPVETVDKPDTLYLTDSLLEVVSVDTVTVIPLRDELLLNGRVELHPEQVAQVYSLFGGLITDVRVEAGDYIRKGDVLAIIKSGEVAELEKDRVEAEQQLTVARRNLNSVRDMFESGMASELELLQAKQELAAAESELKRLEETFSINGITGSSFYSVVSPISGFVIEKNINKDMIIRPDMEEALFTLSGLEEVLVEANVYESDISKVSVGAPVRITTLAYKDKEFTGTVNRIFHILNSESKTMSVRITLRNEDYLLKPGLFANVYVQQKREGEAYPAVASRSVIFEDGKNYVVCVEQGGALKTREVKVYKQLEELYYIREGLHASDLVVHENALLVYNAIK